MRALVVLIALIAPARIASADENETVAQLEDALAGHHLDRAERLLAPKVQVGPLAFPADDCKHFNHLQMLADKDRGGLIDCLARLAPSGLTKHHSTKVSGAILVRDGVALGAMVADRQITAVRFVDTDGQDATIPTVFRAADQIADHVAVPDDLRAEIDKRDDHRVAATLKTCLDATGKVTRTRVVEGSGVAAFDVLARWTIEHHRALGAVQLGGTATAACEVIHFDLDTRPNAAQRDATRPITITMAGLEPSRTKGTPASKLAPDAATRKAIAKAKLDRVRGTWKACFDATGSFVAAQKLTSTGFAAFDTQIDAALKKWAFQAVPERNGVCTVVEIAWHS